MQANELYTLGCRAYNGDEDSRREWFRVLAPLAQAAARPYGVLPGIILARAACESGWASDLYELVMERRFGVIFSRKAQEHNNLLGMVAYGRNDEYAPGLPAPTWASYKAIFSDYAPHGDMAGSYGVTMEPWKEYRSIEDAFQDFAAVIRSQAWRRGEQWPADIRGQLLSVGRGYTPEGAASQKGMDYAWQDKTLELYSKYNLSQYDNEVTMGKVKVTTANLDAHIKMAYEYAHTHCYYAATDRSFPPMEDRKSDCAGLLLRAGCTLGYNFGAKNIDQVHDLCKSMGMVKTTDINDAWKRHGVVCMQYMANKNTQHINHVYYSLGGSSLADISKYDLGSDRRIKAEQPFAHVDVDEWGGEYNFLCMYYIKEEKKREDVLAFETQDETLGTTTKRTGLYAGPGTAWRKLGTVEPGKSVILRGLVSNDKGNLWRAVRYDGKEGYIYSSAAKPNAYKAWNGVVSNTDGSLSIRVGAGGGCYKIADIPEGKTVTVNGSATASDGSAWLHVVYKAGGKNLRGYVAAQYVIKA